MPTIDKKLASLVLEHAKRVVSHPSRRTELKREPFLENPFEDLDIEFSMEENPFLDEIESLFVELRRDKPFHCVAILDTSSSMSGDKHLLASIAVAVFLLQVPDENNAVIQFASEAKKVKGLGEQIAPEQTILNFLRTPPRGFTNIARGLEEGLRQFRAVSRKRGRKIGLIATDGRATEGRDPLEVARSYDFLTVLHLHGPGSHLEASQELAAAGHGVCLEVERYEQLPRRMYDALRRVSGG